MTVQSINYGAVQTAYVSSASYTLDTEGQILDLFWPTPYTTSTDICAATNNFTTTAINCSVSLPNANEVSPGMNIYIRNVGASTEDFSVFDNEFTLLQTISPGTTWWFQLIEYSDDTAGVWAIIEQGAGTSQATAAALAGHGLEAVSAKLDTVIPPVTITSDYIITENDQSKIFIINSAAERTITLDEFRGGFAVSFNNIGSGNVNFVGTVDNITNFSLATTQSVTLINDETDTTKWWSLGLGSNTSFIDSVVNISLNSIASGGTLILSSNQLNNFIHQFYASVPITGDIIIYYGSSNGNWYIANFCTSSNGSTISIQAGNSGTPLGTAIEVPMETKVIAYIASDPLLAEARLFLIPTSFDISTLFLEDGSVTNPSLSFLNDTTSGLYLDGTYGPSVASHGMQIVTFSGVDTAKPSLLLNPGTDDYPSYTFIGNPTYGMGYDSASETLRIFSGNAIFGAAFDVASAGAVSALILNAPTTGNTLDIGVSNTTSVFTSTISGISCDLNLTPSANQATLFLGSEGGTYNLTTNISSGGTLFTSTGQYISELTLNAPNATNAILQLKNQATTDISSLAVTPDGLALSYTDGTDTAYALVTATATATAFELINQANTDLIGGFTADYSGYGLMWTFTPDGGTTVARARLINNDVTQNSFYIYSPTSDGFGMSVSATGVGMTYKGNPVLSISNTYAVLFDQRQATLNALLPNPASNTQMIAFDGTNWVLTGVAADGGLLYFDGGSWISTATPALGSMLYYDGGDWVPLPIGTNGQVLTVVGGIPAWA